jgi:hypothetical protein
MTSMDDFAPEALAVLLPYLDAVIGGSEEVVDGTNPDHPDQTFNYVVRRADGPPLALEFVRAWDEVFLDAPDGWDRLCVRVQGAVREQHPAVVGRYTVGFDTGIAARMKDQKIDELVGAVASCDTHGVGSRVDLASGVTVRHTEVAPDLTVEPYRVSSDWELGPSSQLRFAKALTSKGETLARAGAAGYETHLAVIHWSLGNSAGWRQWLAEHPPAGGHPQNIWAVDLNRNTGTKTKPREPAERIYP